MDASPKPKPAQRRTRGTPARPRRGRQTKPSRTVVRPRIPTRFILVAAAVVIVFAAALVLDTAAVMRLAWACMAGSFGYRVRIAAIAIVTVLAVLVIWASVRPQPAPRPIARKARRRPVRKADPSEGSVAAKSALGDPKPGDTASGAPGETVPMAKRRARRPAAKADQPLPG